MVIIAALDGTFQRRPFATVRLRIVRLPPVFGDSTQFLHIVASGAPALGDAGVRMKARFQHICG